MPIDITTLTIVHTALSFIGLAFGIPAMLALLDRPVAPRWTTLFIVFAVLTTATGFLFPFHGITPAVGTGIVTTIIFVIMAVARYAFHLAGIWRGIYKAGIALNVYFLFFVLIAQAFLKVPGLHALAPQGNEPPFAVAQLVLLAVFCWLGYRIKKASQRVKGGI